MAQGPDNSSRLSTPGIQTTQRSHTESHKVRYWVPYCLHYTPTRCANDTTIYCIGRSVDQVTTQLNRALQELSDWCLLNSLIPHPTKCEAMILKRDSFIRPLNPLVLGKVGVNWVTHTRLVGVTIGEKLNWARHIL